MNDGGPSGFVWAQRKDGRVEIRHRGRLGEAAGQQRMARLTGNYQRGNERPPTRP